jgi:hypothetical protein
VTDPRVGEAQRLTGRWWDSGVRTDGRTGTELLVGAVSEADAVTWGPFWIGMPREVDHVEDDQLDRPRVGS